MSSRSNLKDMVTRNIQDILQPSELVMINNSNANNRFQTQNNNVGTDSGAARNLSKSIKLFVESHLTDEFDEHFKSIVGNTTKETWKIDACNLSNVLYNELKLSNVHESLFNILDSFSREVKNTSGKYLNESELDCSPLLQPKHIIQVAECMSVENPLDVRLNALHCLLKSHFTDAVNGESWSILKRILVDNLCDSNQEIFLSCLKAHVKLASCSSSVAIKECALNLMESLGRHYFLHNHEYKTISLQHNNFYQMVYLTRLLLDTFREATLNIARFGDSKLDEMIENFIQLMNIHATSKQTKNKSLLTPLEVVSYLDPNGKWLSNLTHFFSSRQFLFSNIAKNVFFMRVIIEELLNWINEPVIPTKHTPKVLQGELNNAVQRYCMFCHSLSVFSTICLFSAGKELFPIKATKKEELLSVKDILKIIIKLINDHKFNEILHTKATESFRLFIAKNLANIFSSKDIHGFSSILMPNKDNDQFISPITIQIYDIVSSKCTSNLFNNANLSLKRKFSLFFNSFAVTDNSIFINSGTRTPLEPENKELLSFDEFLKLISDRLKNSDLRDIHCIVKILTQILKEGARELGISYTTRQYLIYLVSETYMKLHNSLQSQESEVFTDNIFIFDCCAQFLLSSATSTLGFYFLKEVNVITPILFGGLQNPIVNWSDPAWLLFVSKSATTCEGYGVLFKERDVIIRKELSQLWNIIDEDCSGSDLPIEEASKCLLKSITSLISSLRGVKALLNDSKDGSELTLTDEGDVRPSNIYDLILYYALNADSCPDFIHHQFALTVLNIIISNIDSNLHLQNKFKYQDLLLKMQAVNRIDDNSEVIIDECSLLRQKIIEKSSFPNPFRNNFKPTHIAPRLESTYVQAKPRSRGTGELARWLSETRLGLHDYNWLKHVRKLFKNSSSDDMKGSIILDLVEQVIKVFPDTKTAIKWEDVSSEDVLLPEEQIAVQFVMRYGAHHRLIQSTQQNMDNFIHLILVVKNSLKKRTNTFEGFDWFVASAYLLCSGNVEKTQHFLSLVSGLPTAQLLWINLAEEFSLVQIGHVLEEIIAEELPIAFQALQSVGLSWWQMCHTWISQCWWNVFDWTQICYWFTISILHQPDYPLYFCASLLYSNQDRLIMLTQQEASYEIIMNPVDNFQLSEVRTFIDKLHKKYHIILQPYFSSN